MTAPPPASDRPSSPTAVPRLHVIVASTREQRVGMAVADWFHERARRHGGFELELIDLKAVGLPLLDEPNHPRLQRYQHAHTKAWSETIRRADAFVFVTPEYNYGPAPALVNALDYLYVEWQGKPAGFVSYGGVSGGTRSVVALRQIVSTLKMVPIVEAVTIPFVARLMEGGVFKGGDIQDKAAGAMLDEIARWEAALRPLRHP